MTIISGQVAVIEQLVKYFEKKLEVYSPQIIDEFPNHNEDLSYPTILISTSGTPEYRHLMKTLIKQTDNVDNPMIMSDNIYSVGQYDMTISVDIWLKYKADREQWAELIMDVFDSQFIESGKPSGLSLTLENYYGIIARYDQIGYNYLDGEESSQRDEWRIQFTVLSSFVRAIQKTEPKVVEATITHEVGGNDAIDGDTENSDLKEDSEIY